MELSVAQQERYARHLLLDGWGGDGQERLLASTVRVRGSGPAALWACRYLAASGVGALLVDAGLEELFGGLNPDVVVAAQGTPDLEIAPAGGCADGARAALQACASLIRGKAS